MDSTMFTMKTMILTMRKHSDVVKFTWMQEASGRDPGVFFLGKTEDIMMFRETNTEWSTAVNV